jgi:voltage-gated potassium channel
MKHGVVHTRRVEETHVPPPRRGSPQWRDGAFRRYRELTELPMLVLAVALIPLLLAPVVFDLGEGVRSTLTAIDWFIWAAFAADYLAGLALAPNRRRYVRTEWASLLLVALPFLRPLRIVRSARALRLLRLIRVVAALSAVGKETRRLLVRHNLHYALLATLVLVVGCATLVYAVEVDAEGNIGSFPDALWWAITTVTTVGYGDRFPITAAGRGIAAFLMIGGIALFGVVTANLAAFVLERDAVPEPEPATTATEHSELVALLHEIRARLDALERRDVP